MTKEKKEKLKIKINEMTKHQGIPLSEESYKEWEKVFVEIEEVSKSLKEIKI